MKHFSWILGLLLVLNVPVLGAGSDEAERVIIVVNENDAGSVEIGEYYAAARGIPKKNIIRLKTSSAETITVQEYVDTIYNPLLTALLKDDWVEGARMIVSDDYGRKGMSIVVNSISYLVTTRGVPLRISNDPSKVEANLPNITKELMVNRSAVDSDLALLLAPTSASMTALIPNPHFEKKYIAPGGMSQLIRVSRLDGYTVDDVKRLVDRTLEAEETGLMGRAYIDIGGPYKQGDEWISAAGSLAQSAYFDTDFESSKKLLGLNNRYDGPAIYMGWYYERAYAQWALPSWSVPPGAIGFHFHSYSATSVREKGKAWLGAFVKQGYCATMGNVYEPYANLTHRPDRFLEHLLEGHTFGEAVFYSNPALSWMGVAIGDPLYRPFKVDLKEQLSKEPDGPYSTYVYLREINRLQAEVSDEAALNYTKTRFFKAPTLVLAYKLSGLYEKLGQTKEAVEALKIIRYITVFATDEQILVKQIADKLHELGESALALDIYERLIAQRHLDKSLRIALLEGGALVAATQRRSTNASRWSLEARQLKASGGSK
ncbi:MAG: TIGR03790 family protein [Opitutaceae bacterium]